MGAWRPLDAPPERPARPSVDHGLSACAGRPGAAGYGYRGALGLPLLAGDELVGALGVGFTTDRTLPADDRAAVVGMAAQGAQAMRRARLLQAETDARTAAERLTATMGALSCARTPPQMAVLRAAVAAGRAVRTETAAGSRAERIIALCGVRDLLPTDHGTGCAAAASSAASSAVAASSAAA